MNKIYQQDCSLCPRLVEYRAALRQEMPEGWNAPVEGFGDLDGKLLIIGLAPGKNGANRTSRPFTGDSAGDFLYGALQKFGFAKGNYGRTAKDGFSLVNCRITNAVKCVPPQNKPIAAEIHQCRPYLTAELTAMKNLQAILCLGKISHDSVVKTLGLKQASYPFKHGAVYTTELYDIYDSYHCSRYNTNTGRLNEAMFHEVLGSLKNALAT